MRGASRTHYSRGKTSRTTLVFNLFSIPEPSKIRVSTEGVRLESARALEHKQASDLGGGGRRVDLIQVRHPDTNNQAETEVPNLVGEMGSETLSASINIKWRPAFCPCSQTISWKGTRGQMGYRWENRNYLDF